MPVALVAIELLAGALVLLIGACLAVNLPTPRRWMVAALVAVDAGLLAAGFILLPIAVSGG